MQPVNNSHLQQKKYISEGSNTDSQKVGLAFSVSAK